MTDRPARFSRPSPGDRGRGAMTARPMKVVADPESRPHDAHHDALRLWLRLFTCTQLIDRAIRARFRCHFNMALPRFDPIAQLERNPERVKMVELTKRVPDPGGNLPDHRARRDA